MNFIILICMIVLIYFSRRLFLEIIAEEQAELERKIMENLEIKTFYKDNSH